MKLARFVLVSVFGVMLFSDSAWSDAEGRMPQSRIGIVTGLRENLGNLSTSYDRGALLGFEAGYLFYLGDTGFGIGPTTTTMFKGWYFPNSDAVVDDLLEISEISIGLRVRRLAGEASFFFASGGGTMLSTEIPTDADKTKRRHYGGYGGAGFERYVLRRFYVSVEGRYEFVVDDSPSASVIFSISAGH